MFFNKRLCDWRLLSLSLVIVTLFPALAAAEEKEKIFIQNPKVVGLSAEMAESFGALIAKKVSDFKQFEATTMGDLAAALDLDQQKELLGCDESSCMIEIRNAIGARYSVNGTVSKFDEKYVINLSLIDTDDFKIIARASAADVINAPKAITDKSEELLLQAILAIYPAYPDAEKIKQRIAELQAGSDERDPHLALKVSAITVGAVGGLALAAGGIFAGLANSQQKLAHEIAANPGNSTINELERIRANNRKYGVSAITFMSIGGAAAITSVALGAVYAKKHKKPAVQAAPVVSANGLAIAISGNW